MSSSRKDFVPESSGSVKTKKGSLIETSGLVLEILPNACFRVKLDNGHILLAHTAGKIRKKKIRIVVGDRVTVEMSIHDNKRGRIAYRERGDSNPTS